MNDTNSQKHPSKRQQGILMFLLANPRSSHDQITDSIPEKERPTRVTISRDLKILVDLKYIVSEGKTKGVVYSINSQKLLWIPLEVDDYYAKSSDERDVPFEKFNPKVFEYVGNTLFSKKELEIFDKGKKHLSEKMKNLENIYVKKELERFVIELSWKSSQIEGNTYSLLETEELIKNKKEAKGRDHLEAVMILNHKKAFDTILEHREKYTDISLHDIRTIHSVLVDSLNVPTGIRERAVGITGTKYVPLDNKWQIEDAMSKLIKGLRRIEDIPSKALFLLAMISYVQPFADGNKRTARMVSNAILLANGFYPLSYRSVDEVEFKRVILMFYEQNNIFNLKEIFLEQQQFAIKTYFM